MKTKAVLSGDIGGTHIRFGVVDLDGDIIRIVKRRIKRHEGTNDLTGQLISLSLELLDWAHGENIQILAVGVGIAGKIDSQQGRVLFSPNLPEAKGQNISAILSQHIKRSVFIDNDANTFGRGEAWKGKGRMLKSWVGITLGTGVGGCIVLNKELWQGEEGIGFVGEIGHMTIHPDGLPCACGKLGCLEAYASEGGLLRRISRNKLYKEGEKIASARDLYMKAKEGDSLAINLFEEFGKALGIAIANVFTLLGIRHAIVGGGVSHGWDVFKEAMYEAIYANCSMLTSSQISVVKSELGDRASILGAAKLAIDKGIQR